VRAAARLLAVGWLFHFKMISRSSFDAFLGVLWPLFFATVAFFMFRAGGGEETLLYASLGAAVMGIWSVTSTSAGAAMQRERWHGTLEVLVASPAPFALVLLPITIAMTTIGLYCMLATLLWGRLLFGIELRLEQPLLFALSLPVAIVSIGTFGFLLAVAFVRYRFAWALGNLFEYPVWLICGFLVPLTLLPEWVRPISWLLAPTWGMRAIRESALGGSPLPDLALCLALAGGYTLAGVLVLDSALKAARARASLSLT
jgi:ABC-2 type transport system permease protein